MKVYGKFFSLLQRKQLLSGKKFFLSKMAFWQGKFLTRKPSVHFYSASYVPFLSRTWFSIMI